MAKSTRIIHHNQLLMTKFERICDKSTDDVKSAASLQVNGPLTEIPGDEVELFRL